jgi:phosphopantetheinyl transferase (holo-ACP synthase)
MSVLGIGVDMVEVERIQHSLDRFGERFMKRVSPKARLLIASR